MKVKHLIASLLIAPAFALADVPHIVPNPNCPAGQLCAPSALVCSFIDGCGALGRWQMQSPSVKPFDNLKIFNYRYEVIVAGYDPSSDTYNTLGAEYYSQDTTGLESIKIKTSGKFKVTQKYQYSFMKQAASCTNDDSAMCGVTEVQ